MPKYTYKPIKEVVESSYEGYTGINIYESLGQVDFDAATLIIEADNEEAAVQTSKGIVDFRMWQLVNENQ